jgi:aspartyl-tRNA synthetase
LAATFNLGDRKDTSTLSKDKAGENVTVAGWVQDIRNLGGIAFILLRDRKGIVQVTALKKKLGEEDFTTLTGVPRESVIVVNGELKLNEQVATGYEVLPETFEILSPAETPLPLGIIDKVGVELDTRLNNRFLDLRKEQVLAVFRIRDLILRAMREYFSNEDFLEVQTPKIVAAGAEGGSTLFPIKYFEKQAFLAQSPQLYKQMLMAWGFERIYEIAPAYRAEQSDTVRHLAEFSSVDVEMSFIDSSDDIMDVLEELMVYILDRVIEDGSEQLKALDISLVIPKQPFPRIPFKQCVEMLAEVGLELKGDLDTEAEKRLGEIIKEKLDADLYFITDFPTELKKETFYAMHKPDDPELTGYFDLGYRGEELVSGGQREHRYDVLVNQMKDVGISPDDFKFYLGAFKYGMPPHGGFGLGVERLLHMMLSLPNIRECVLFPRDMYRVVP